MRQPPPENYPEATHQTDNLLIFNILHSKRRAPRFLPVLKRVTQIWWPGMYNATVRGKFKIWYKLNLLRQFLNILQHESINIFSDCRHIGRPNTKKRSATRSLSSQSIFIGVNIIPITRSIHKP